MTEKEARWIGVCRALLANGYEIHERDGFIEITGRPLVFRVLADRPRKKARPRSKMLSAAPEEGPQRSLPGIGSEP